MTTPLQAPSSEATTSIDSLLDLLKEKGKVDLNTVSISLGIGPKIIEGWAKVLENGKLIKISYEVGKMYLELLGTGAATDQGKSAEIMTEAQKSVLQNEMEVEKITLDRFSTNLDELSSTVAGMENLYKQKLPNIQKLFSELDGLSAPIARKTKELDEVQKSAESYFGQLDKRVDSIFEKVTSMEGRSAGATLRQKEESLRATFAKAEEAKAALVDLEDTKQALYSKISSDIDRQVKEFKAGLKGSVAQVYTELKADAAESVAVDREIKAELAKMSKTTAEVEKLKKDTEGARADLIGSRNIFKDKYQKIIDDVSKSSKAVEQKYMAAQSQLAEMKAALGEVAHLHDSIVGARAELSAIQTSIEASKASVQSILETLRTMDTLKNMGQMEKAKVVEELSRKAMGTRAKRDRIKKSLKETSTALKSQSEGKR